MLNQPPKHPDGVIACCRYAFMPNKLQYCGGKDYEALFELTSGNESNGHLSFLLKEFQTLYPYLKLIAAENNIKDIFDYRVVEAYWIGNELLENIRMDKLYRHFIEALYLKKKLPQKQFEKLTGKISLGAKPHHSFHVFNIWTRTGHLPINHTIETMDSCRIGWGKITKIFPNELKILSPKIILQNDSLKLSKPENKIVTYKIFGKCFIDNPKVGQWVSSHWNWACDILTAKQVNNLKYYTNYHLQLLRCEYTN